MCEHRDDNHPDTAAETCFADTGEPCPETEGDNFVNSAASLKIKRQIRFNYTNVSGVPQAIL